MSEETAESIAGHISREMKKRYSHVRLERMREAVDALAPADKKPVTRHDARRLVKPEESNRNWPTTFCAPSLKC